MADAQTCQNVEIFISSIAVFGVFCFGGLFWFWFWFVFWGGVFWFLVFCFFEMQY